MIQRYESVLVVPEDVATPERFVDVVERIRETAWPTVSDDGLTIRIEWELNDGEDGWELRDKVESVKVDVESMLGTSLVWERPT